jgi:hypothetical protein
MLQPKYTMHGFNWFNQRGTEGVGFVRALRTLLTNNLPQILPLLSTINKTRFEELIQHDGGFFGKLVYLVPMRDQSDLLNHVSYHVTTPNGFVGSEVYPIIVNVVVLSNAVSFFGQDLGM